MTRIPQITISGTPHARGVAYGSHLREHIRAVFDLYWTRIFAGSPLTEDAIRARAAEVARATDVFAPDLATEMAGIAEGAGLEPWQIVALNARTEILNAAVPECTTLYFAEGAVLGQTWDWLKELEDAVVLLRVEYPDGRRILTLTEPGMLAKIGMNDRGVGVGLNILMAPHGTDGIPVHILARALIESESLDAARSVIARAGLGKSSHLLLGDASGRAFGVEYAGDRRAEISPENGFILHTNHCLAPGMESTLLPSSGERLQQAQDWLSCLPGRTSEDMRTVLSDGSLGPNSILASYRPEAALGGAEIGTCATILMDLPARTLHARKGPHPDGPFEAYPL